MIPFFLETLPSYAKTFGEVKKRQVVVTCGNHSGIRHVLLRASSASTSSLAKNRKGKRGFCYPDPEYATDIVPMKLHSGKPYFSRGIFTLDYRENTMGKLTRSNIIVSN